MAKAKAKTREEQVQSLLDNIPVTGEIDYADLREKMVAIDNKDALGYLFPLKRQGVLKTRVEHDPAVRTLVSRA